MNTTEDKLVALMPCRLFDACLRALYLADAKVRAGVSRICSILIDANDTCSKTAVFKRSQAKNLGDSLEGAVRCGSASSRVKIVLARRAC